jgi:ferritin-like metal-binding protein YciE
MAEMLEHQLVTYLIDAYALEQQSLAQLRTAPDIAGAAPTLAQAFREHVGETERQAEMLKARLEAHGEAPSGLENAVMALGGKGFLLFAELNPDTPGKLTAHAYSYESLEWAAYELLWRIADRAGDRETMIAAQAIRDNERSMMERLAACFDEATAASIAGQDGAVLERSLGSYLRDAHALEMQSIQLLDKSQDIAGDSELARIYAAHAEETREQARAIEVCLERLGEGPSILKDAALRLGALNWGLFFQALGDTPPKLAAFAYAVEHLEIAGYELLRRVARRAGSEPVVALCDRIVPQERRMAERIAGAFDSACAAGVRAFRASS